MGSCMVQARGQTYRKLREGGPERGEHQDRPGASEEILRRGHLRDHKKVRILIGDTLVRCGVGNRGLPFGGCHEFTPGLREDDVCHPR